VRAVDLVKTRMQNQRVRLAVGSTTSASSSVAQAASSSSTGAAVIHRNSWQCFLHVRIRAARSVRPPMHEQLSINVLDGMRDPEHTMMLDDDRCYGTKAP